MATTLWPSDKKEPRRPRVAKSQHNNFNATFCQASSTLGACLVLLLGAIASVQCDEFRPRLAHQHQLQPAAYSQSARVNSQLQLSQQTPYSSDRDLLRNQPAASDLNQDASAPMRQNDYSPSIGRPSVYHSIIDQSGQSSLSQSPAVQTSAITSSGGDLNTAAGHHHGHHAYGKYYEYRAVPKKKTWKFGYKRGNHKHTISRHEHGKAGKHPHFKTKVKWHDKKSKGKGIHLWDYNHHDKKHYHHHGR